MGLPVVEHDGRLVGVLSRTALLALASDDPEGAWHGRVDLEACHRSCEHP